jgi:hypothetical protein
MKRSTQIQSILFDRQLWTVHRARKWLVSHGKKYRAVEPASFETGLYHRFRQLSPKKFDEKTFRTIELGGGDTGITAIIGVPLTRNPNVEIKIVDIIPGQDVLVRGK